MGFEVFDYRKDIKNLLTTPQIRSRFLKMEVGQVNRGHSHDLGHEIFLILQGQAEFEIEGVKKVVGPGQLCLALTDEIHTVRNVGEDEVIMYLSVTPHIQPTHTAWTDSGSKEPPRFRPNTAYDVPLDQTTPSETLADSYLESAVGFEETVETTTRLQRELMGAYKQALAEGDERGANKARDKMWESLYTMFKGVHELADTWNAFTSRTADQEYSG